MEKLNTPALILVDKPFGSSSQYCVNQVKRQLNLKKIGHCGTLDPAATGLLICLTGAATRLANVIEKQDKVYSGLIRFGEATSSYDLEGEVVATSAERPEIENVRCLIKEKFFGEIQQIPPKYSAVKVEGKRAYALARKGEDFQLKTRNVQISQFDIEQKDADHYSFIIKSSVGTYIRSIANDLGRDLGVPSCLAALRRQAIGGYQVSNAKIPEDLREEDLTAWAKIFPDLPRIQPDLIQLRMLLNGDIRVLPEVTKKISTKRVIYEHDGQALGLLVNRDNNWKFEFQAYGPDVLGKLKGI